MARAGNTTGLQDDATANALDKIENSSVPITRTSSSASTSTQFRLTAGSTRTPTNWTIDVTPPGLTMTSGGLLSGTFSSGALGQTYTVKVTATDGAGTIDVRGFTIAPNVSSAGDNLKLLNPLPGGIVNSKFGPRMHPIQHVMKMHTGVDLKLANSSTTDVVAAADGVIVLAGGDPNSGYGLRVWVDHFTDDGRKLCTTTYNHLAKIYVSDKQGQKVMAGQALGREGSTGASTGNHLHFEVRLPDGKFTDPEPLINGSLTVASKTLPNGDADSTSLTTRTSDASLTSHEAEARSTSCQSYGSSYPPASPPESTDAVPAGTSADPFELAWYFTMQHEVGPFWSTAAGSTPTDPDILAGSIDTTAHKKNVGYVNTPNDPGGETKFGVAQRPNPGIAVHDVNYANAKKTGYNNYWQASASPCGSKSKLVSVMLFDMNYLHGPGNAKTIYQNSGITSTGSDDHATQLSHVQTLNAARVTFINQIQRPEFTRGWLSRASACLAYVNSLP
jgi:murein DD-endopeptidase MepM/ murein hydrolase activator NlpD